MIGEIAVKNKFLTIKNNIDITLNKFENIKIRDDLLEINKLVQNINFQQAKDIDQYTERQGHGFKYENEFIKRNNIQKSVSYTSQFDGDYGLPIQIKYMGNRNEVCLGDYKRNLNISQDFILHIAFYKEKNILPNIEEYTLYINHEIYSNLFKNNDIDKVLDEFRLISNDKSDNAKFKLFRNKYKKSNGIIHIRFKRDHKKQKRIQAAIPYGNIQDFVKLFKSYKINNDIPGMSDTNAVIGIDERRKLEKFYTKDGVVISCMNEIKKVLIELNIIPHILEPSAGDGAFIKGFENFTYTAYDICPESDNIKKADFLQLNSINLSIDKKLVVIGNPPYKLAIKFINKCASLNAELICFILPNIFKKPYIINKIDRHYHLLNNIQLPKNSFNLGDNDYNVPSSLFIFHKQDTLRTLTKIKIPCIGYKYTTYSKLKITDGVIEDIDISVLRVGGRAGKAFSNDDVSKDAAVSKQKYNYFIKLSDTHHKSEIINKINDIKWEKNNTTGPRSIGKYELTPLLNDIISSM